MYESTGGGWGYALTRDPQSVLDDVLDEYISFEAAKRISGVAIDPLRLVVDAQATSTLRAELRAAETT